MMDFGQRTKKRMQINITALVDILIVLLLFFMLTTEFIRREIMNLTLSAVHQNQDVAISKQEEPIIIVLNGNEEFVFQGKSYNLVFLKDKIKPLLIDNLEKAIIIYSKELVTVQDVVTSMEYMKEIGATNISLAEDRDNVRK